MEIISIQKFIHTSPRKLRLVADMVRKLEPNKALEILKFTPKMAAREISSAIAISLANAKQKQAKEEALRFKRIEVMGGPVMKRWHAVSKGMAHAYKKRMTHIRVVLTDTN